MKKIARLDSEMVEILRKRHGLKSRDLAARLGYRSRQGYYAMLKLQTLEKVPELAQVFGIDKKTFVIVDC